MCVRFLETPFGMRESKPFRWKPNKPNTGNLVTNSEHRFYKFLLVLLRNVIIVGTYLDERVLDSEPETMYVTMTVGTEGLTQQ